jgi:hypothetical protein
VTLIKYNFRPGISREGTEYSSEGGWFDADKMRFRSGLPEKIGGWTKYSSNTFLGTCRSLFNYAAKSGTEYVGLGTHLKFYINDGTTYNDITPIRATTSAGDVTFAASNGSSTITVTDASHGAVKNDYVTLSGAVSLGGLIIASVLNQEYQIDSIVNANSYKVIAKDTSGSEVTANSSDSGNGGSSVVGAYQINVGLDEYVSSTGWGAGAWDSGGFGSATSLDDTNQLRIWSQDNFGDDLLMNPRMGGLYYWDQSAGTSTRAVAVSTLSGASDTPTNAFQVITSDIDRHVICFGVNPIGTTTLDPMHVRWSDQESAADWTPTSTNTSGGVTLSGGSEIIGALRTRQEIVIWTDAGMHSMRFSGAPFIFTFNQLLEGVSMISPNAAVNANNAVFFMDRGGFYSYSGSIQALPCTVLDYIYADINLGQAFKCFATSNIDFNEVMWFYPSSSSDEIDRYVIYNYVEGSWSIGTLARTAWIEAHMKQKPLAAATNNYLYIHEDGHDDDGSAMTAYIESADFDLEPDGEYFMFLNRLVPDVRFKDEDSDDEVSVLIKGRDYSLDTLATLSTSAVTNSTSQSFIRARTRQAVMRVESSGSGYGWRLGSFRLDMRQDGRR